MTSDFMLRDFAKKIIAICEPEEIFLFSHKTGPDGMLSSFKLCVVVPECDSEALENRLYLELESDVPFDLLVYSKLEWERLLRKSDSFASQIKRTGRTLNAANQT